MMKQKPYQRQNNNTANVNTSSLTRKKSKETSSNSRQGLTNDSLRASSKGKKQQAPALVNLSRQVPIMMTDLYKAQTQYKQEINDLMNQVDLPDDDVSLTASSISQVSQSPFHQRFHARTRDGNVSPNMQYGKNTLKSALPGTSLQDAIRSEHFNSTEGSHVQVPPELTTLGKSDESGTVAGHNQMSGTLNRMILGFNGTRGTQYNGTGGSHLHNNQDTVVVSDDQQSEEETKEEEAALPTRPRRTNSPDFNRNTGYSYRENNHEEVGDSSSNPMNLTTTTYDLTVSHTHQPNQGNVSQRNNNDLSSSSIILNQPIYVTNKTTAGGGTSTNRTFADSVINHQQQQQYSGSSNHNTYRQHQHPETKRYSLLTPRGQSGEEADHDDDGSDLYSNERRQVIRQELGESESSEEDAYGMNKKGENKRAPPSSEDDNEGIDPSEMSAIDSFAQTQYSKFSKYQHSKLGHSRFEGKSQAPGLTQDQKNPSVKTPQVNRKVAITGGIQTNESEALSLTPSTNNDASRWGQLTQKSYLTANNASSSLSNNLIKAADHSALTANNLPQTPVSQYANNRTSTSDNPLLNRLTTNIPQVLNTNRTTETASQEHQMIAPQIRQSHHYHNRSLQRDPELERALEEDSENQTLKRASSPGGTLEDSKGSSQQQHLPPANPLATKLSNLKVQLAAMEDQRNRLALDCEAKDHQLAQLSQHLLSLETQLEDKHEHVQLLQAKFKDDSSLARMRNNNLEHARRTINQLQNDLMLREERLQAIEREIKGREADERAVYMAQKEEITRLHGQIDTMSVIAKGKDRQIEEVSKSMKEQKARSEEAYQVKIREMDQIIDQLRKSQKAQQKQTQTQSQHHEQQIKDLNQKLSEMQSQNAQLGSQNAQISQDREKYQAEMKQYKERARVLDQELEQLRAFEHSSLKQRQQSTNEYELKHLKDLYEKKLQKSTEDLAKKSTLIRDLEVELARSKEGAKSIHEFHSFQENIRFLFVIGSDEDILQRLTLASQDIREIPSLQKEIEKLKGRLEESTRQLVTFENTSNQSMQSVRQSTDQSQMSNFLRTLLLEKDKQIDQFRLKYEEMDDKLSLQMQECVKQDSQLKILRSQNNDLVAQINQMHLEVSKSRENQSRAETQADELKEKLRLVIREQQEEKIQMQLTASQTNSLAKTTALNDTALLDSKYQDLLEYILSMNIVEDPLNALLQESSNHNNPAASTAVDQAKKHLQTQVSLVHSELSSFNSQIERLKSDHQRELDIVKVEKQSIATNLERIAEQQRDVEQVNAKLRVELDQTKQNLKKALKAVNNQQMAMPAKQDYQEIERVMMCYEDLLARQVVIAPIVHHMRRCSAVQTDTQDQNDQSIMVLTDMLQVKNHEADLFELNELLSSAQREIEVLKADIDSKNQLIENLQDSQVALEEQHKLKQGDFLHQIDILREQVTSKSEKLEQEYDSLQSQKSLLREETLAYQRELDRKQAERQLALETDFFNKLKILEQELRSSQSKEASIATICHQMQQQTQSQMNEMADQHQSQMQQLKQSHLQVITDMKAKHAREAKGLQLEIATNKKISEDKAAKREVDYQTQIELIEQGFKDKIENEKKEKTKALAQLKDKLKAEQRNALDVLKNEQARAKAEFEREKKQLNQAQENDIQKLKRDYEDRLEVELRQQKDKLDKQWKKKVDEVQQNCDSRIDQIQNDMAGMVASHKEEMRKERDRVELLVREQLRHEVKVELTCEMEKEYQTEISKMVEAHNQEVERVKQKYLQEVARVEKACQLPHKVDTRIFEVQCDIPLQPMQPLISDKQKELFFEDSINEDIDNTGLVVINNPHNQSSSIIYDNDNIVDYARQNNNCNSYHNNEEQNKLYIHQLKQNYEAEMERQLQVFEVQLIQKQQSTLRIFEELMTLEFDKILQSIYLKKEPQRLDGRRREINGLINDILARNDDRRDQQMRQSMDSLKKKINQTLKVFKEELDSKFNKKMQIALQQNQQQQPSEQKHQQSRDISDIVSTSCKHPFSQIGSEDANVFSDRKNQFSPTNRVANNLEQFAQEQAQTYQEEGFFIETESGQQLLRKIAPVPNTQGVLMVEVDKVCRDLQMLVRTITHAKFYKIFIEANQEDSVDENDEQRGSSHEASLQRYRVLLNQVMRIIVQLNQGATSMGNSNEVYRVKLANAELRDHIKGLQKQIDQQSAQVKAESILSFYLQNTQPNEMLSRDGQACLSDLEACQFAISKQHLKILQLKDLFMAKNQVNRNILEVNKLCGQYVRENPGHASSNDLMQSQYSPSQIKIVPEMLSPEETAQLMASVFQRITNNTNLENTTQTNAKTQQSSSFFQTFLSNEANIRCAENFIQRYKEQLMSLTHKSNDLPRQLPRGHHLYASNDDTTSRAQQYRSHSGSSQGPVDTRRVTQSTVTSNIFLKNVASAKSLNLAGTTTGNKSIASTAAVSKANQPYQSIQLRGATQTNSSGSLFQNLVIPPFQAKENYNTLNLNTNNLGNTLDELSNVQSNLNLMIEKANNNKGSNSGKSNNLYSGYNNQ